MKTCSVFMDVEDPVNSEADDAALEFARLFSEVGVRGSFCITGEKCRTLLARGRTDVIEALSPHALGIHTNTHSQHPTTMELLADVEYSEGCDAAMAAETPGIEAFTRTFGRLPCFWGGAGNTWSCEIPHVLRQYGIPAYSYALTRVPDDEVHRFDGVLALPQALAIAESDWMDRDRARNAVQATLDSLSRTERTWTGIFVGHPTRFRFGEFWDAGYFGGRTPAEQPILPRVSDERYALAKENLSAFLFSLTLNARVIGVDEAVRLPRRWRKAEDQELRYFRSETTKALQGAVGWPIHRPDLSAHRIVAKTMALAHSLETLDLRPDRKGHTSA